LKLSLFQRWVCGRFWERSRDGSRDGSLKRDAESKIRLLATDDMLSSLNNKLVYGERWANEIGDTDLMRVTSSEYIAEVSKQVVVDFLPTVWERPTWTLRSDASIEDSVDRFYEYLMDPSSRTLGTSASILYGRRAVTEESDHLIVARKLVSRFVNRAFCVEKYDAVADPFGVGHLLLSVNGDRFLQFVVDLRKFENSRWFSDTSTLNVISCYII
jgi:hypothetical protein